MDPKKEEPNQAEAGEDAEGEKMSKSAAKKAAKKAEKERRRAEDAAKRAAAEGGAGAGADAGAEKGKGKGTDEALSNDTDGTSEYFGTLPFNNSATREGRTRVPIEELAGLQPGTSVLLRGRIHSKRVQGKKMAFYTIRQHSQTIQVVLFANNKPVTRNMVKFASEVPLESIVDVEGVICEAEVKSCTIQTLEISCTKLWVVVKSGDIPITLEECSRSDADIKKFVEEHPDEVPPTLLQMPTRLDHRVVEMRAPANQAIWRLQGAIQHEFRTFLIENGFNEIHTPKLIGAASEGGANVFKVQYFNRDAFLAQSPQLYKQMAIVGDMDRVFEIAPVFRAEDSNTHRHLTEFIGLDLEMAFNEHYHEVLDMLEGLFTHIFTEMERKHSKLLDAVAEQYPFERVKIKTPIVRLEFPEAVKMLRDAGIKTIDGEEVGDLEDFDTPTEKALGKLVREKYDTDFYILDKFPLAVRPFYTMPDAKDPNYSNSYDFFLRGEEILSGAQRVHDYDLLLKRVIEKGVPPESIQAYIDAFKYGAPMHAGAGIGMERLLMLYLGFPNVRMASMFPRDPRRLSP